ncbi:hypothetical protein EDC04DRAFT_2836022 [Pisolithus marmoratus]|nr:hypothetical protein EDC04DRAFT_2836022 [Pisolithus marmoratus]
MPVTMGFVEKLYKVLEDQSSQVVSWDPNGDCFVARKGRERIHEIGPPSHVWVLQSCRLCQVNMTSTGSKTRTIPSSVNTSGHSNIMTSMRTIGMPSKT